MPSTPTICKLLHDHTASCCTAVLHDPPHPICSTRLAETLGAATKAEPDGLAATPARGRGAAAPAASGADGTKASPATPHSAPRSAFKARTNVRTDAVIHHLMFLLCASRDCSNPADNLRWQKQHADECYDEADRALIAQGISVHNSEGVCAPQASLYQMSNLSVCSFCLSVLQ
jgi:hypothetical protein